MPYIDGSQAQKHVTHNEALRILDAAIQIAVLDLTRTAPPSGPADGERHVVAAGATGAWAGQANAIATWQDGAWAFLAPKTGWCIWSSADAVLFVFDGTLWRDLRSLPVSLDNTAHVGINTTASSPNLLSVTSNAALFAAIDTADGGTGDVRLQLSKKSAANTASVCFSDNYSGRAEFGLVGDDAFKLKVSPDGSAWVEAFNIDQDSGNLSLPRGLALTGVIAPAQIAANQNDYNPVGFAAASVLQMSSDTARSVSGLAGGAEGRVVSLINVGSQSITLLDESASSSSANRFTLGGDLTVAAKQATTLRYDGAAARWQAIAGAGALLAANNLSDLADASTARANLGIVCPPQGRLTLVPGTPVMTAAQSGKTTLYYTPYIGNMVPIFDGANMVATAVAEVSQATTDTAKSPAAVAASSLYDIFVWNDSGTMRATRGPAWSTDTTRGAGAALTRVNGIWLNNASIANGPAASRGTYVGTIRSNASSQIDFILGGTAAGGAAGFIGLWNCYNRVDLTPLVQDSTASWLYNSTTLRNANGSAANRISFVRGLDEDGVTATYEIIAVGGSSGDIVQGIGLDATATTSATYLSSGINTAPIVVIYSGLPGLGFHFLQAVEKQITTASSAQMFGVINGIQLMRISARMKY